MKLGCKVKTALARDVYTLGAFRNLESPRFKPPCLVPAQGPHLAPAHVTSRVPPGLLSPPVRHRVDCTWAVRPQARPCEQRQRPREPVDSGVYGPLILEKGARTTPWTKDRLFHKWCWESWKFSCKRMKLDPSDTAREV